MKNGLYIVFIVSFLGCIKEHDYEQTDHQDFLVVFGEITNNSGPYKITLTRTAPYTNSTEEGRIPAETGAEVYVLENNRNKIIFEEDQPGVYWSVDENVVGIPGNLYILCIKTKGGEKYRSKVEVMPQPVGVERLTQEYVEKNVVDKDGIISKVEGYEVVVSTVDPQSKGNYYLWKWMGTFKLKTNYDLKLNEPDCWKHCYKVEVPKSIGKALNDELMNGNTFSEPIAFIEKRAGRFSGSPFYNFVLYQHAITKDAYVFWDQVNKQTDTGDQMDPPPSPVQGNVYNINNPEEEVLGFFSATSVFTNELIIKGDLTAFALDDKCIKVKGSLCEKPASWPF